MLDMILKDILIVLFVKQVDESSAQATTSVYRRPTNMSNSAMTQFSLGKARLDPQRIVPSEMKILRNHPSAIKTLRLVDTVSYRSQFNSEFYF